MIFRVIIIMSVTRLEAKAIIKGGETFPDICGEVLFYRMRCAVMVKAVVSGLPNTSSLFYGFHIHSGENCGGKGFSDTGGHYDSDNRPHPRHSGDMPPLISYNGNAYMEFKTNRFSINEIIGKTIIIHGGTDDFRTQPSGDSGEKIACGVIVRV